MVQYIDEVEIEALPTDLPEKFEVDVSGLAEVDQFISVGDLKFDKSKIKMENDPEQIIVKIEPLRKEEEELPPAPEVTEGEGEAVSEEQESKGEKVEGENNEAKEEKTKQ